MKQVSPAITTVVGLMNLVQVLLKLIWLRVTDPLWQGCEGRAGMKTEIPGGLSQPTESPRCSLQRGLWFLSGSRHRQFTDHLFRVYTINKLLAKCIWAAETSAASVLVPVVSHSRPWLCRKPSNTSSRVDDRVLGLRPGVRPEPLRWESWVQDTGPPETSRPHVISIGESSPRDLCLNAKTQLHAMTSKLQCWTPDAKQLARQEHKLTH